MPSRIIQWQQPLRRVAPSAPTRRAFTSAQRFGLKEDKPQSPEEIEAAKQEQMKTGRGKEELESQSEAAVGADQQKVQDDDKHMADLQKQTAKQKQEEHPHGKSVHHPLTAPPTTTTAGVAVYLPRGPILDDPDQDASNISILQSILSCHVVQVNYRCGISNKYPTPIHDVALGYDWIVSNLLPKRAITRVGRSEHVGRIAVCGELIGGQLATMLALTECRAGQPGVVAAAVSNAIVDWVAFEEEPQVWPPVKKQPLPTTSNTTLTTSTLVKYRSQLFRKSAQYYDPFASPTLFFRTAGSEIPEDVEEEERPLDDLDELARFERDDFFREQRALSAVQGLLEPSLLSDVVPARKRKTSRRYPSKALGLHLPRFLVSAGLGSTLSSQSEELAHLLRQSFARQTKSAGSESYYEAHDGPDVSEDNLRHEQYPGLGLWDDSEAGRSKMRAAASWIASTLAR